MAVYSVFVVVVVAMAMMVQGVPTDTEFDQWLADQSARHASQVTTETVTPDMTVTATEPSCVRYVGKKGSGAEYSKVKSAVKSIPEGGSERCVIYVAAGTYNEKFEIPKEQSKISIIGAGASTTIIENEDTAETAGSTSKSATVAVMSDYFIAQDITFSNTAPPPPGGAVGQQAVAFRIEGDKAQFLRVAFLGAQDTLYDKKGRHYFKDCYIKGSIDFVFGAGLSYYDTCHLVSIANPGSGSLTAQKKTTKGELSGFSFVNCLVTGNGPIYLGRAWGQYSEVVFSYTQLNAPIIPAGWFDWADPARQKTVYYGQYKCTGVGANTTGRVSWSKELTDSEAAPFLSWSFVDGDSWIGKV
jgi:pectinesterase